MPNRSLAACHFHQRFTLRSLIKLLEEVDVIIRFDLYSTDGQHMSAIRINNQINISLPDIIITDIDEADDVPYGEGFTIVKNITPDLTTYTVFID